MVGDGFLCRLLGVFAGIYLRLDLVGDTTFSASESADAMEMLAKNGLNASQILDGAVSASMKLAAASGSALSSSADVATDVMMNFGKSAKELGGLVDGITGVLLESKFGFDDYRLAIGQAGGVAGNLGVSFEDFNASIVATSSAFSSGSDAGTSFKAFLTRLVPVSKEAAATMKELDLSFFNADGSMKSMSEVAEELRTKMSSLSDQDLNEKMKTIFGVDAMRTAIMLMKTGGEGLDTLKEKIGEASAEEQAAARLKGFNGELEKLSGAFETLQINIADSGLLSVVTDLVSKIAEWVDKLAETNPQILKWGTVVGGLAVVLGPVVLAVGALVAGIAAIGVPVAATVAGIAALVAGLVAFAPQINAAQAAIEEWVSAGWNALKNAVNSVQTALENLATVGVQAVANLVNGVQSWIEGKLSGILDSVKSKIGAVGDAFKWLYDKTVGHSWIPDMVTEIGQWMAKLGNNMVAPAVDAANQASSAFESVGASIDDAFSGFGSSVAAAIRGTKKWSDVVGDLAGQFANLAIKSLSTGFFGSSSSGIGGIVSGLLGGLFGFANGGSFKVGGAGGIDSQVVAFRASPDERVSITKPGQDVGAGGGIAAVRVYVDDNGNWDAKVEGIARNTAAPMVQAGMQHANAAVHERRRRPS